MNVATVRESSMPRFMILKHRGMISVCIKKLMASLSSPLVVVGYGIHSSEREVTFTRAPITPKLVTRRFSKALDLLEVLRNG